MAPIQTPTHWPLTMLHLTGFCYKAPPHWPLLQCSTPLASVTMLHPTGLCYNAPPHWPLLQCSTPAWEWPCPCRPPLACCGCPLFQMSKNGKGFILQQEMCSCDILKDPLCCPDGWHLILAGSHFSLPAESRYVRSKARPLPWPMDMRNVICIFLWWDAPI